jgi:hypothetical protein
MTELAPVEDLLELACRAPSVHNTQPWQWRVQENRVDLFADVRRQLVHADPQRRDLMLSCGAALHHFQVAAQALGWSTRVRRAPDASDERLVASVQLSHGRPAPDADELLAAIRERRTDRRRLTSWPVPAERLNALCMVGNQWGAQLLPVYDERAKRRLEQLTRRADVLQRRNPAYVKELDNATVYWANVGVPVAHIPREDYVPSSDALNRRFPHGVLDDPVIDPGEPADGMLIVCTSSDDTLSRIRAGEALSAVWLQATRDGMSMVPLSQALEVEETRRTLQHEVLDDKTLAQIVVRVGWLPLSRRELPATPRRDVADVRIET